MSIDEAAQTLAAEQRAGFLERAARLAARARACAASRTEFELALGVLLVLSRSAAPSAGIAP